MKYRKCILVILGIGGCGIWIYDIALILKPGRSVDMTTHKPVTEKILAGNYVYQPDFSDPFFCSQFMNVKKVVSKKEDAKPSPRKETITLPACRIGGIVYTPGNPMAIFISGDTSRLVKQGDTVDSITIVSIMPQNVEVSYRGRKFTIKQ